MRCSGTRCRRCDLDREGHGVGLATHLADLGRSAPEQGHALAHDKPQALAFGLIQIDHQFQGRRRNEVRPKQTNPPRFNRRDCGARRGEIESISTRWRAP